MMGKYGPRQARTRRQQLNPLWRGVGCLTAVGLMVGSYFGADWFFTANLKQQWVYIPPELSAPNWVDLPPALGGPQQFPYLYAKVVLALLAAILGFAIFTLIYGIVKPIKPGELDAPPPRRPRRRRRR